MRIAFDGTVLHGCKSGVGYYCEELLKAMLKIEHGTQFVAFSHKPLQLDFPGANGNLTVADSIRFPIRALYLHVLLPKVLDGVEPDLCHYTNFLAPVSERRPYVVTIHDMGMESLRHAHPLPKRLYTKQLVPSVARKARLIITNSEFSKWEIVRLLGIPEDRIRVTPLAAAQEFVPTPRREGRNPYFLYVGNLEPRKNLERLVEAFGRMPSKDHDLVIIGNRWYRGSAAEAMARSLGLESRVRFAGYVPRADLPAWYSNATAFVYPSLLEGFGLPVVEAMACGTPVITSNTSSMSEIAGEAALLVDPHKTEQITAAMTHIAEDPRLRHALSKKGMARATEFSWEKTACLTLDVYEEAVGRVPRRSRPPISNATSGNVSEAIQKTIDYAKLFQYPLTPEEVRERLFEVKIDDVAFHAALKAFNYKPDPRLLSLRKQREEISEDGIREVEPHLRTLASLPFVRMVAFSGSTAHKNMTTAEDIDLFMVVEDGKLWAMFLVAMVWAKLKGLRAQLCMNYLISDAALPLVERDVFTAQQAASLKPLYGKAVYDRFLAANPFITRYFPNFNASRHREAYPEFLSGRFKGLIETVLRFGPIQLAERFSRIVLGRYLSGKINPDSDVQLDRRRLKLHLHSHKKAVLRSAALEGRAQSRKVGTT